MKEFVRKVSDQLNEWSRPLDTFALLGLRLSFGVLMIANHGWGKLANYSQIAPHFPDPLGLGSELSLTLAVFAEFFCSILIFLGLFTRLAAIPLLTTMLVAGVIVHWNDPWGDKELAFVFATGYFVLLLKGAGCISLDALLKRVWLKK